MFMSRELMFLALLPGVLIIIFIFRKDKVEKEPMSLLLKLVAFGAISCIPAIFMENFMEVFNLGYTGLSYAVYEAFAVAAFCEEICKYVLLRLGSWKNKNFDYRFDGIVYGVCVAVGFALLENVLYVAEGGIVTAIMRALLAVPLHAFCGAFMGIFYGAAKKYQILGQGSKCFGYTVLALIVPMMIHGIYDTLAFLNSGFSSIMLLVFVAIMYVVVIKVVNKFSRDDWKAAFYQINNDQFNG